MDTAQKRVLTRLAADFYRPVSAEDLAANLKLSVDTVESALTGLVHTGVLEIYKDNYYFNPESDLVAGYFQAHAKGYGFVHVGGDRQYYVGPGTAKGARDGDIVLGEVLARNPGKAPMLKITDFLHREDRLVAAKYSGGSGLGNVQDGNRKIMISTRFSQGAKDGDCVLVSVSGWEGRVVSPLPQGDEGRLDLLNIAAKRGVVPVFSPALEAEAAGLSNAIEVEKRLDLRDEDVVTVDGESAKDLDDGFSLSRLANGNWRLVVHIADVAHYVAPESALDREAFKRALSVYLLDREVPMLPAKLSRDLCSLLPGLDRPAVSCIVELTPGGEVVEYKFAETVIRSRQQLTYAQVDEGRCGPWNELVDNTAELVRTLHLRRRRRGAAYIDLPATSVQLDDLGKPVAMGSRASGGARGMVEELMVLVNELAADYLHDQKIHFLYRGNLGFHPDRGDDLNAFISRWGLKLDYPPSSHELQQFLDAMEDGPQLIPVCKKLARCLQKSRYSSCPLGHYNMGVERYLHFSSPIRRYSDLFIHRQIKQAINGLSAAKLEKDLPRVAEQCSFRERLAQDVEGECLDLKKLQFMESLGSTEFQGLVTDMTGSGPWVFLDNTAEGVVVAGADREVLTAFVPGDTIPVRVHKLDYKAKQIYFALAGVDKIEA